MGLVLIVNLEDPTIPGVKFQFEFSDLMVMRFPSVYLDGPSVVAVLFHLVNPRLDVSVLLRDQTGNLDDLVFRERL